MRGSGGRGEVQKDEKREKGRYEEKREERDIMKRREGKVSYSSYLCFIEQQATLNIINPLLETTHGRENDADHLNFWSNIGCDSRFFCP